MTAHRLFDPSRRKIRFNRSGFRRNRVGAALLVALLSIGAVPRQIAWPARHASGPWNSPSAIIVPDPYSANKFNFARAFSDPKIKAVILKGAEGLAVDPEVYTRAAEAKRRGIPFGVYLLAMSAKPWKGKSGKLHEGQDPNAQADLIVKIARDTGASLLAVDVEGLDSRFMAPEDVAATAVRIESTTNPRRYPLFYANKATVAAYAARHSSNPVFSHMPLWLAGLPGFSGNQIWRDYVLLQFGAEWDCGAFLSQFSKAERRAYATQRNCAKYTRYPVAGSNYDLDVNLLSGHQPDLDRLFGAPQH